MILLSMLLVWLCYNCSNGFNINSRLALMTSLSRQNSYQRDSCLHRLPSHSFSDIATYSKEMSSKLIAFSRPHTVKGTLLASSLGIYKSGLYKVGSVKAETAVKIFIGTLSLLLGNLYIVGLNQIYDKAVDRV